jgi:general secretion pathway protein N
MKRIRLAWVAGALAAVGLVALGATAPGAAELTNPLAVTPLDRLSDTRERPLFAPNRRKPPPEVVAAPVEAPPPPPPAPPKLLLYGIVQDSHGARAIVKPGAGDDDKTLGLRVGDHVESWSVTAIDHTKLTLSLEERSVVFSLFDDNGPSDQPKFVRHHMARVIELNAAGVLTARRVGVAQP